MPITSFRHPNPYAILPDGWDTAWRAALANSGTAPAALSVIGDSISIGQYSSNFMSTAWWPQLRTKLLASHTLGADYYSLLYSSAIASAMPGGGMSTTTYPVTVNGVANTDWIGYYCGYNYAIFSQATSKTPLVSCTPPYPVVGFDIIYMNYQNGNWTWNVDGGSNTTVTTTGPNLQSGAIVSKVSVTGLASGTHTLNINSTGTTNTCAIMGIVAYSNQTTGLRLANHAWPGQSLVKASGSANALGDTTTFPPDRLGLHQGYQGTTASPSSLRGFGFPAQPDLAIIAHGNNDASAAVTAAQFEDYARRLVQVLRYGKSDACSILFVGMYAPDTEQPSANFVAASDTTAAGQIVVVQEYYDAMRNLAQEYNCGYVSVRQLFGRTPAANGWVVSGSNIHPSDNGHTKIATLLESIIL